MKLTYRGLPYDVNSTFQSMDDVDEMNHHRGRPSTCRRIHRGVPDSVTVLRYRGLNYVR